MWQSIEVCVSTGLKGAITNLYLPISGSFTCPCCLAKPGFNLLVNRLLIPLLILFCQFLHLIYNLVLYLLILPYGPLSFLVNYCLYYILFKATNIICLCLLLVWHGCGLLFSEASSISFPYSLTAWILLWFSFTAWILLWQKTLFCICLNQWVCLNQCMCDGEWL